MKEKNLLGMSVQFASQCHTLICGVCTEISDESKINFEKIGIRLVGVILYLSICIVSHPSLFRVNIFKTDKIHNIN
jgi:hypothetical protein